MGIKDLILKLRNADVKNPLDYRVDDNEGIDFNIENEALKNIEKSALESPLFGMQLSYLRGLHEQGLAEKNANGFTVLSENVVELEDYFFDLFDLPKPYEGRYQSDIRGNTSQAAFTVSLQLILKDGSAVKHYKLSGPFLQISESEIFRLAPFEYKALRAVDAHSKLEPSKKGEYENNWLIFQLQLAKKAGMQIDLGAFNKLELIHPEKVGVALEETPEGDLILTPTYGSGMNVDDIKMRLGQIDANDHQAIFRVKDRFVLLDEERLTASHEILTNRRIPKEQVAKFLKAPTAYLDSALIDLDTGFSLRVHGAEKFVHRYFGDVEESGIDWFAQNNNIAEPFENINKVIDSEDALNDVNQKVADAREKGAEVIEHEGKNYDISNQGVVDQEIDKLRDLITGNALVPSGENTEHDIDEDKVVLDRAVVAIDSNDEDTSFSRENDIQSLNFKSETYEKNNLKRMPFEHQEEGIIWLLAHYELGKKISSQSGALLADDMGLGKTYMTLVSIAEWYRRCKQNDQTQKPVLIVAPLSLLENWQAEAAETFHKSPFTEIIVLQAGGDLKRFKLAGAKAETQQKFDDGESITDQNQIRYSLKVGKYYDDRLDKPGRLVLTTYQTLRDYQFSLSLINWSVVAFDEAQYLKNPNALSTRAAKGLNADFKLLATGTPVENTLKDFWCLMDTAVPGLLGAWQEFRRNYIVPITQAEGAEARRIKIEMGGKLRKQVGDYMLRRTKEGNLKGLPQKRIFVGVQGDNREYLPLLAAEMSGEQLKTYETIIAEVKNAATEDKRKVVLPSLLKLKLASIHQDLLLTSSFKDLSQNISKRASLSSKVNSLLSLLKEIKQRQEKVLIFATSKSVQALVSVLIAHEFKILVETINGETKAVSNNDSDETRKGIIDKFQSQDGFGILIMSPVAAGVGLTITGANNVIHLERHWNPAKEAQATDRVYRIGQKRDVNVYIPISLHPSQASFDVHLNNLLSNKIDLSDAVVAPEIVDSADLAGLF